MKNSTPNLAATILVVGLCALGSPARAQTCAPGLTRAECAGISVVVVAFGADNAAASAHGRIDTSERGQLEGMCTQAMAIHAVAFPAGRAATRDEAESAKAAALGLRVGVDAAVSGGKADGASGVTCLRTAQAYLATVGRLNSSPPAITDGRNWWPYWMALPAGAVGAAGGYAGSYRSDDPLEGRIVAATLAGLGGIGISLTVSLICDAVQSRGAVP